MSARLTDAPVNRRAPATIAAIALVRGGMSPTAAALAAGACRNGLYRALKRDGIGWDRFAAQARAMTPERLARLRENARRQCADPDNRARMVQALRESYARRAVIAAGLPTWDVHLQRARQMLDLKVPRSAVVELLKSEALHRRAA